MRQQLLQACYVYCTIGRGKNREGFNFKLAMVKTCSTWPLLNKYTLWKKIWSGSSDSTITADPIWPVEKEKIENLNLILAMVKMYSN